MTPKHEVNEAMEKTGIEIMNGLEWTTFYGHMVVLGMSRYVDWRNVGINDIHAGIAKVHEAGGIAGIAHPYRVGSPLCTGCFWQFQVDNWHDIDYIEIWSEFFPPVKECNQRALTLWTGLLNEGYHITGTYGLDWHAPYPENEMAAATYLQIDKNLDISFEEQVKQAIKSGKVSVSMGPLLLLSIKNNVTKREWGLGDDIPYANNPQVMDFNVSIDFTVRTEKWKLGHQPLNIVLQSNQGIIKEQNIIVGEKNITCSLNTQGLKWVRAELYGYMNDVEMMVAFTNPIYFKK